MSVIPDHVVLASTAHVALACATNSQGQTVCNGGSAGLFASLGVMLVVYLAILVLSIVAAVKIITKAGYSGWWIFITFIPLVGTIFVFYFAFAPWPITREVQMLRAQAAERRSYGGFRGGAGGGMEANRLTYGLPGSNEPSSPAPEPSSSAHAPLPTFGTFLTEGKVSVVTPPNVTQASVPPAAAQPPAGWYPNPGGPSGQLRYWDGSNWTDQVQ